MSASYKILNAADFADSFNERHTFALDILVGLSDTRKFLPSKYMYDDIGSRLFVEITELPEYYLTKCELSVLENNTDRIAEHVRHEPFNLVELGAGSAQKTMTILDYFTEKGFDFQYVPIDISEGAMKDAVERMGKAYPSLDTTGLVSDYFAGLKWLNNRYQRKNLVLFLGSSIGNFSHQQARFFMKNVWSVLQQDDLVLTGFDLKKDIERLLWAYNDPTGVTARFNLNLLERINRELGGEFDVDKFRHYGTYDVRSGAMESYLVSLEQQEVWVKDIKRSFHFAAWEPIHLEYSYKYLIKDVEALASETGFSIREHIFDDKRWFVDSIFQVEKDSH